ncbi:PREDICTED: LOC107484759 isoform [Prunus dulcis]|uniref:PREDICTED: LOC107484759 isoform n=1 Tax=Prunus dulcis TaxID=3755 RepID=A0A5E4F5P3_PRUDU|nr:PREDICTED: LOC107484759 isoform [Prunus dulcis]
MDPRYEDQVWVFHGEHLPDPDYMEDVEEQQLCEPTVNEIHNVLYDVFESDSPANDRHVDTKGQTTNVRAEYAEKFYDILNDANTHLYPGSTTMKKLEFLVKLYQAKCLSSSIDKGMDIMLKLVKSILLDGETLTYQKIDACPNDCMLYLKESILDDSCKHCGQSRYRKQDVKETGDTRKVPAKVLRYLPLAPRLQRLYLSRQFRPFNGKQEQRPALVPLSGIDGKSKDTIKARADLKLLNIKPKLHPVRKGSKTYLPPAAFNLSNAEKTTICEVLASIKVPDGFSSNITRCVRVKERNVIGLKSHDCHVMLHEFLPIAIRCVLNNKLCMVMIELCSFFRHLCQKNLSSAAFSQLTPSIALTLCHLECIFPPAFFTIMKHLPIQLAEEA